MPSETLQKDFIWKALHEGWTVKKECENTFKFVRAHNGRTDEFTIQGFLGSFLQRCLGQKENSTPARDGSA